MGNFTAKIFSQLSEPTENSHARYLRNNALSARFGGKLGQQDGVLTSELITKVGSIVFAGIPNLGNLVRMFGLPLRPAVGLR